MKMYPIASVNSENTTFWIETEKAAATTIQKSERNKIRNEWRFVSNSGTHNTSHANEYVKYKIKSNEWRHMYACM